MVYRSFQDSLSAMSVLCAMLSVGTVCAADLAFPSAGGDLASAEAWGGTVPGAKDNVLLPQPSKKYKISDDVTFGNLYFSGDGTYVVDATKEDGSNAYVTITTNECPLRVQDETDVRYVTFSGGIYDIGGADWCGGGPNSFTYFDNSSVLTNVGICWSSSAKSIARLYLQEGSKIFCSEFRIAPPKVGRGLLSMTGGSLLECDGGYYTDKASGGKTDAANSRTIVSGEGTVLRCAGMYVGLQSGYNSVRVESGGKIDSGIIEVSDGSDKAGNVIAVTNGTLVADEYFTLKYSSTKGNGNGIRAKDSEIVLGAFTNNSPYSYFDFQNVDFTIENGPVQLFPGWSGSIVRFGGKNGTQPEPLKGMPNYFTTRDKGHSLIIDDGFCFTNTAWCRMFSYSSNSLIRVTGGATYTGTKTLCIGHSDYTTSIGNTIEITDGGVMSVEYFNLMGTGNRLVVSNGTLKTETGDIRLGYKTPEGVNYTTGSRVLIAGPTPRLHAGVMLWMNSDNVIRFEIPASGYAPGYSPITASGVNYSTTSTLEVGYEEFLAAGGGEVALMTFSPSDVSNVTDKGSYDPSTMTFTEWVAAQDEALLLPPRCRLYLKTADGLVKVMFRASPPLGSRIVIR